MKLILLGVIVIMLVFPLNANGQSYSKEQLKSIEQEAISLKKDTTVFSFDKLKTNRGIDLGVFRAFQTLDSLLLFVNIKKQDRVATFEADIVPFLEVNSDKLDLKILRLSEDETLVYDSFLQVLEWEKAIETVKLYEDFILKSNTTSEETESVLTVLSFIKYLYFYIESKKKTQLESFVCQCIAVNFEENNDVDWKVFALNPGKLILWTIVACAWDSKPGK